MMTNTNVALAFGTPQDAIKSREDKEQEFTAAAQAAINTAHSLEIRGENDLHIAAQLMNGFKTAKQSIADFFKPMKDAAHKAHKEVCDREKTMLTPYDTADRTIKTKVTAYNAEQRRLAELEAARLRAAQEEESRRLMDEAVKAESGGNGAVAESLLKQAAITETIQTPIQQTKVHGISYRQSYSVVVEDLAKVPCEINGVVIRPVDEPAVKKLAQLSKGAISIPGIKIVASQEAYSR